MLFHRRLLALAFASVLIAPAGALAMTSAEAACRDAIAKSLTRYVNSVARIVNSCNQKRSSGERSLNDVCNDPNQADLASALPALHDAVVNAVIGACAGQDALLDEYPSCPSPAPTADDGGATDDIDDFGELADCVTALADGHMGQLADAAQGEPEQLLLDPLRKCQSKLAKGTTKIVMTYMQERRRCQKTADANNGPVAYTCTGDPRGRIEKAVVKFQQKVGAACSFSPEVIQKLEACSGNSEGLIDCAAVTAELRGSNLIQSAYELIEENFPTSTTTTTTTSTTTTTLPGTVACNVATAPTCDGNCPVGTTCQNEGGVCSCSAGGSGPCAPATIIRTIHAKYGADPSMTALSTGWSGTAHDVDIPNETGDVVDVVCDSNCQNCAIDMNVQQGNPASNCRCTADSTATCTVINGSDPDSCGSLDPTCRCYFGAPLPLSSGGTPACVINRIRQDYNGTMNLRTGTWNDQIRLASVVYLGLDTQAPCPTCNGDPVMNDGVRGGTCAGGLSSNACDANGEHATFGATSFDCLPASAANVSGSGLLIKLNSSSGQLSLDADLPCDTPAGGQCHCRVCTGNGNLGCATNGDCEEAGAGLCTAGGGAGVKKNECTGFDCASDGQCTTGPVDTYCDGVVHPDGRGFIPCTTDSDCAQNSAGNCTVQDLRRCFPDPIVKSGNADTYEPTSAALFCIAPTSNPAINLAAGLPGAGSFVLSFNSDIRCKSAPSLIYEFPDGANCGAVGTTTTTLLPLPECAEADAPACGGICPSGSVCGDLTMSGTCSCTALPVPSCDDATAPLCGGICSDTSKICQGDGAGGCRCTAPTLPQCSEAEAPLCGGLCPTGELCQNVGGACECGAPGVPTCGTAVAPVCGGLCDVGEVCTAQGAGCGCTSLGLPVCSTADPGTGCLGTCAVGSLCQAVLGACQCVGIPLP